MQFEWIIVGLLAISSCKTTTCTTNNTINDNSNNISNIKNVNNSDIKRMWAAAFKVINDDELLRIGQRQPPNTLEAVQRPNSKRMKWRTNSKQLDTREEAALTALAALKAQSRSGTYPSTEEDNVNPSYLDVRDYEPQPLPWWF
ncbi:GH24336 [Drosophila grimshawi]|uniref:GH24336 n=1 Tax=Drosophila grimshawi TaxID=7222 RepID=B4JMG5_DROGR|nr:GH24336 [Drosophila grimshawi]